MLNWLANLFSNDDEATLDEAALAFRIRLQDGLAKHGFWDDPVDGEWSHGLLAAVEEAHAHFGLTPGSVPGPKFLAALEADPAEPEPDTDDEAFPEWLITAEDYLGLREIHGPHHAEEIVEWWQDVGAPWFTDDETPWCGAFVGGVLHEAGFPVAEEAPRARAWLRYGQHVHGPAVGAIVVFWRGHPESANGHVGFVAGRDEAGRLMVLGGNQGDRVSIAPFTRSRVLGYRWPPGVPKPADVGMAHLPVIDSNGEPSSTDES